MNTIKYIIAVALVVFAAAICGCDASDDYELLPFNEMDQIDVANGEGDDRGDLNIENEGKTSYNKSSQSELYQDEIGQNKQNNNELSQDSNKEAECNIFVYVCGAVNYPCVCELPADSRMIDAVEAAGGFASDAAREYMNLASKVSDGQKVYVPTNAEMEVLIADNPQSAYSLVEMTPNTAITGENSGNQVNRGTSDSGSTVDAGNGKININTADIAALTTIPGIGETKAKKIIDYRNSNGGFDTIEDIMLIQGIKEGMFNKIKDYICVQ